VAAVASAVCIAQAAVLVRRFPPSTPVTMNAVGMTTGAALLLARSMVAGEARVLPQRVATWAAVGYLVVVGCTWWCFASGPPPGGLRVRAHPFVTVVLSAWLDNDPLGLGPSSARWNNERNDRRRLP
jgi:hypothetical protein